MSIAFDGAVAGSVDPDAGQADDDVPFLRLANQRRGQFLWKLDFRLAPGPGHRRDRPAGTASRWLAGKRLRDGNADPALRKAIDQERRETSPW